MSHILIIGAKSDIAMAVAREYARHGYNLYLAAKQSNKLTDFANDLIIRHSVNVECIELDVVKYADHELFYDNLTVKPLGIFFIAGYLGSQVDAETNFIESSKIISTNYAGAVSLLNIAANDLQSKQNGFIVGVSSVAGDRGRGSNYLYGSSKAALSCYLSGLRNRLNAFNVNVLTVKPGYVNTKMTKGMQLPKILVSNPDNVAKEIYIAQKKKQNVLYTKWLWKWLMMMIKVLPESIFKRMSL
jgi:decaprenylphospho-beta-D-erythro-pentofuranosid-2-ulose 2-reductase